jgi:hypothetical protein
MIPGFSGGRRDHSRREVFLNSFDLKEAKQVVQSIMNKDVRYIQARDDKRPYGKSWGSGTSNCYDNIMSIPSNGGESRYGIIYRGDLVCFDLDVPTQYESEVEGYLDVWDAVDQMSELFNVDLRRFVVGTPSGGLHVTMRIPSRYAPSAQHRQSPEDFWFPVGHFNEYNRFFKKVYGDKWFKIKGDFRSGASNAYVLGPEVIAEVGTPSDGRYMLFYDEEPDTLPVEACKKIRQVTGMKRRERNKRAEKAAKKARRERLSGIELQDIQAPVQGQNAASVKSQMKRFAEGGPLKVLHGDMGQEHLYKDLRSQKSVSEYLAAAPSDDVLQVVASMIQTKIQADKGEYKYHALRAFATRSLWCCYDEKSIIGACILLHIDQDTSRRKRIPVKELVNDIKKFYKTKNSDSTYHGHACPRRVKSPEERKSLAERIFEGQDIHENIARKAERIRNGKSLSYSGTQHMKNNQEGIVLDYEKMYDFLYETVGSKRVSIPKQVTHAMMIFDYVLQPYSNIGLYWIVIAYSYLMEHLGLTKSQVRQAMRLLREVGAIYVVKKQAKGIAPVYMVNTQVLMHVGLTKALKRAEQDSFNRMPDGSPHFTVYNRITRQFQQALTGKVVVGRFMSRRLEDKLFKREIPSQQWTVGPGSTMDYLKKEREELGLERSDRTKQMLQAGTSKRARHFVHYSTRYRQELEKLGVLTPESPRFVEELARFSATFTQMTDEDLNHDNGSSVSSASNSDSWIDVVTSIATRDFTLPTRDRMSDLPGRFEAFINGRVYDVRTSTTPGIRNNSKNQNSPSFTNTKQSSCPYRIAGAQAQFINDVKSGMYRTMSSGHVNRYAPRPIVGRVLSGKPPFSRSDALSPLSYTSRNAGAESVDSKNQNSSNGSSDFVKNNDSDKTVPPSSIVSAGNTSAKNRDKCHLERTPIPARKTHGFTGSMLELSRQYNYEEEHMLMMMATSTDDRSRQ